MKTPRLAGPSLVVAWTLACVAPGVAHADLKTIEKHAKLDSWRAALWLRT
jgi:hypothetical protein